MTDFLMSESHIFFIVCLSFLVWYHLLFVFPGFIPKTGRVKTIFLSYTFHFAIIIRYFVPLFAESLACKRGFVCSHHSLLSASVSSVCTTCASSPDMVFVVVSKRPEKNQTEEKHMTEMQSSSVVRVTARDGHVSHHNHPHEDDSREEDNLKIFGQEDPLEKSPTTRFVQSMAKKKKKTLTKHNHHLKSHHVKHRHETTVPADTALQGKDWTIVRRYQTIVILLLE